MRVKKMKIKMKVKVKKKGEARGCINKTLPCLEIEIEID